MIKKGRMYLSRVEMVTNRVIWTQHLSEAWNTRDMIKARYLAEKFDATVMMFNPIVWEVKAL